MQQMVANIFPSDPLPTLGMGSVYQNSNFAEHGHVAYQIKENRECSNLVANILPVDPLRTLGMGSIGHNSTILEHGHVAYLIKGNHEMQHHRSKYFACRPLPDPCPCFWGQNVKIKLF